MTQPSFAPDAIFFDMDGLLVDTEPYWLETERDLMAEFGVVWKHEDQLHCLGGPMEKVGRYMASLADHQQSCDWFAEELISRIARKFQEISLMPGVSELLLDVANRRLPSALVSASPRILVDAVLSSISNHPFQLSVSANDIERGKPHPDPYLKAARELGVKIENSLILEDSPTGVAAARSSGAWVIAVPQITTVSEGSKSAIIKSLHGHSIDSLWELVGAKY